MRPLRLLNFGCGAVLADGWTNVDRLDEHPTVRAPRFYVAELTLGGLPFPDGAFEGIVANHSLHQLAETEMDRGLTELRRVLAPGGIIRIHVPDVIKAFQAHARGVRGWAGFVGPKEWSLDRQLCHYLTQGGTGRTNFTRRTLAERLELNGFHPFGGCEVPIGFEVLQELDSRAEESIVINATTA